VRSNVQSRISLERETLREGVYFDDVSALYGAVILKNYKNNNRNILVRIWICNRLCGLVVRVSGYRSRGPGFDSQPYQFF
jgi:hypothetical protein